MKRIVLALAATALFAFPAGAQMMDMPMHDQPGGRGPTMEMGPMDRMGDMMGRCLDYAKELGLSDEQIGKLTPLHRGMRKMQVRFKADLQLAEMEQMETMEVKDFDLDKALAGDKKIADLKSAHHAALLKTMKEVRSILTEAQFKKMKELSPMMKSGKKPAKAIKHKH